MCSWQGARRWQAQDCFIATAEVSAVAAAPWQAQAQPFISVPESDVQPYLIFFKNSLSLQNAVLAGVYCGSLRLDAVFDL